MLVRQTTACRSCQLLCVALLAAALPCATTDRAPPAALELTGSAGGRRLQGLKASGTKPRFNLSLAEVPTGWVTVRPYTAAGPPFNPKKFGGYRSEEKDYYDQIYSPERTLRPLRMVSDRFQFSVQDAELAEDGTFVDPAGTQCGTLRLVSQSVTTDIFVTVGFPWTDRSKWFIQNGFPQGWEDYWRRVYTSVADVLANVCWTGKTVYVEIMGEPDVADWWWVYGKDQGTIFRAIKIAYDAFAPHRGRLKIGGCGFGFPEGQWVKDFLDFYRREGMAFDFMSFHTYLGWNDDYTNPADYGTWDLNLPLPGGAPFTAKLYNVGWRTNEFWQALNSRGLGSMPMILSEYAWQDPDLKSCAGFGDPARSARRSMTHYQSCARTLQAIDIVVQQPGLKRAYWAQGVGTVFEPWWDYDDYEKTKASMSTAQAKKLEAARESWLQAKAMGANQTWLQGVPRMNHLFSYDPFVVYRGNDPLYRGPDWDNWRYKASYYAFWMYGQLIGTRARAQATDPAIGVWAARGGGYLRVAIWNRSIYPRTAILSLPNIHPSWPCKLYRVDGETYKLTAEGLDAVISGPNSPIPPLEWGVNRVRAALRFLRTRPLQGEASVFLVIKLGGR